MTESSGSQEASHRACRSQRKRRDIIGLGSLRWVVERAIAHLHQFRRLAVRWERRLELHEAFATLASSLIC
ncbi:transposase [Glycomyces sp. MUSA5-2]|uniref:transposase n=1 Tax=Glycomyces sp. MUSA5-2 TaxID=2053002 RepID=UPI0030084A60